VLPPEALPQTASFGLVALVDRVAPMQPLRPRDTSGSVSIGAARGCIPPRGRCLGARSTGTHPGARTVLGDDAVAVAPIERHLAYLTGVEGSRSTVEDVGEFVAWLRLPLMARVGVVAVLSCVEHRCVQTTVDRELSVVSALIGTPRATASI
jgi:hypothetical protein